MRRRILIELSRPLRAQIAGMARSHRETSCQAIREQGLGVPLGPTKSTRTFLSRFCFGSGKTSSETSAHAEAALKYPTTSKKSIADKDRSHGNAHASKAKSRAMGIAPLHTILRRALRSEIQFRRAHNATALSAAAASADNPFRVMHPTRDKVAPCGQPSRKR